MDAKLSSPEIQLAKMKADTKQHIQVFVRVRPMNAREKAKNPMTILDCPGSREVVVKDRAAASISKTFTFDRVFGPKSKQLDVYKAVVSPLLEEVLLGYNCTVFAYGQTSTGKTFTMEGERTEGLDVSWENDPNAGIIPRALSQLFDELRLQNAEFTVRVSLLELYNEEIFDLLAPTEGNKLKTLRIFEDSSRKGSVIIQGLEEVTVNNKNDVYRILELGSKGRHTATTLMNANSSRSHTIFTGTVHIKESNVAGEELVKIGKLNLVDLAGSENIGKSGAVLKQAKEAGSINQSLLTLGRVITALVEHTPHVPYRESKLTRLLQDSLGGRTKTSIIATVSPASVNLEETLSTLDYAHRAKDITNRPEVNQKMTKRAILKEYTDEIDRLRRDLVASRERNGVYLAQDNYDYMIAQIEAMTVEINEKVLQVRSLEQTNEEQQASIFAVQEQMEELKDDLETCHTIMAENSETLKATRHELEATRCERDQKMQIVKQQQKTEKELTAQAKQLMATTEETTTNLEKLYRKLDRKKNVEQKNLESGCRFKDELTQGLSSVREVIEGFRKGHSVFCSKQRIIFESFAREKEVKFENLKELIDSFVELVSKMELKANVHAMVSDTKTWNKENVQYLEQVSEIGSKNMTQALEQINGQLKDLGSKIAENLAHMERMMADHDHKIKQQFDIVNSFVENKLETLSKFQQQYTARYEEMKLKAENLQACLDRHEELVKANAMAFTTQLEVIRKSQETFQQEASTATARMKLDVNESTTGAKVLMDLVNLNNETITSKSVQLVATLEKEVQSAEDAAQKSASLLESHRDFTKERISGIENEVQAHIQAQVTHLNEMNKWSNARHNDQDKEMITFGSKFDQLEDQLQSHTGRNMATLKVKLDEGHIAEVEVVQAAHSAMGEHCAEFSGWADQTAEDVGKQAGKVTEFWDTTFLVDGPSGATPQRKAYDYPRNLSATSPHHRIESRYLAERQRFKDNTIVSNDENVNPTKQDEVF